MIEVTGELVELKRDYETSRPVITLRLEEDPKGLKDLQNQRLAIKISQKTKKRSLDSNGYFHVLARKLSQKLRISEAACKNHLIASYGQVELFEDEAIIYKTNAPEEYMIEREEIHTKLVKIGEENGKPIYFYRLYRGTHTYNTVEMSRLIDGTATECKEQGIETATPDEMARMNALWEQRRKHEQ